MREENGAYFVEPEEYENLLEMLKQNNEVEKAFEIKEDESAPQVEVSLYELNQMMVAQMPDMEQDTMKENFIKWYQENKASYFMFLCRELSYYTLFHLGLDSNSKEEKFWTEVYETCAYVGDIKMMEVDTNGALAVWMNWNNEGYHCFYLFPYDEGVVEV